MQAYFASTRLDLGRALSLHPRVHTAPLPSAGDEEVLYVVVDLPPNVMPLPGAEAHIQVR